MAEALIFHYRNADNFLVHLNPNAKLISLIVYTIIVFATIIKCQYTVYKIHRQSACCSIRFPSAVHE